MKNAVTYLGKDGTLYYDWQEKKKADAKWEQQERQNKLIKEQNRLLRGDKSSNISDGQFGVMTMLSQFKDESNGKMSKQDAIKLMDLKSSVIMHFALMLILYPILYMGVLEAILNGIFFAIPNVLWNIENYMDAPIGKPLIAVHLVYSICLLLKYKKLHKKVLLKCNKTKKTKK